MGFDDLGFCMFHHHVRQVMIQANIRYLHADNEFSRVYIKEHISIGN